MEEKRCNRCGETRELSAFHRDRRAKDGRQSWCASCHHDHKVTKRCHRCGETKRLDLFYRYTRSDDGHQMWCKDCMLGYVKDHHQQNPEKKRRYQRWYNRTPAARAAKRRYRSLHPQPPRGSRKEYHENIRRRAVEIYGGVCAKPGCTETEYLHFDHVNGDGREHRQWETSRTSLIRIATTGRRLHDVALQLLCIPHHKQKTRAELRRRRELAKAAA